jgi:hypothetical protein
MTISNYAALRAYSPSSSDEYLFVQGCSTLSDGGEGFFYWDANSVDGDNGGTIIKVTSITTGRWLRDYNDQLNVKWFGALGNGVNDDTSAVAAVLNAAPDSSTVLFPEGTYLMSALVSITKVNLTVVAYGATFFAAELAGYNLILFQSNTESPRDTLGVFEWSGGCFNGNRFYQASPVAAIDPENLLTDPENYQYTDTLGNTGLLTARNYNSVIIQDLIIKDNAGEGAIARDSYNVVFRNCIGENGLSISMNNIYNPFNTPLPEEGAEGYQQTYFKVRSEIRTKALWDTIRTYGGSIGCHYSSNAEEVDSIPGSLAEFNNIVCINPMQDAIHIEHCEQVRIVDAYLSGDLNDDYLYYRPKIQVGNRTKVFFATGLYFKNGHITFNEASAMKENVMTDFYMLMENYIGLDVYTTGTPTPVELERLIENPGIVQNGKIEGLWKLGLYDAQYVGNVVFQGEDIDVGQAFQGVDNVENCTFDLLDSVGSMNAGSSGEGFFNNNVVTNVNTGIGADTARVLRFFQNTFKSVNKYAIGAGTSTVNLFVEENNFVDIGLTQAGSNEDCCIGSSSGTGARSDAIYIKNNTLETIASGATTKIIYSNTTDNSIISIIQPEAIMGYTVGGNSASALLHLDIVRNGNPEGSVRASVGSRIRRADGGVDTYIYEKRSGSGNTGWYTYVAEAPSDGNTYVRIDGTWKRNFIPTGNTTDTVTLSFLNTNYPVASYPVGTVVSYYNQGKAYQRQTSTIWSEYVITLTT